MFRTESMLRFFGVAIVMVGHVALCVVLLICVGFVLSPEWSAAKGSGDRFPIWLLVVICSYTGGLVLRALYDILGQLERK